MLFISENSKLVYHLLLEYMETPLTEELEVPVIETYEDFNHILYLEIIRDYLLLPSKYNHEQLFDLIVDRINKPDGFRLFYDYRMALEKEKSANFINLRYLVVNAEWYKPLNNFVPKK